MRNTRTLPHPELSAAATEAANDTNTVVFKMAVKCTRKPKNEIPKQSTSAMRLEPEQVFNHSNVYSSDLQWQPQGSQAELFPEPAKPVQDNILLAKLRPGQEIMCEMHCHLGVGRDHAKWSPVGKPALRRIHGIVSSSDHKIHKKRPHPTVFCPQSISYSQYHLRTKTSSSSASPQAWPKKIPTAKWECVFLTPEKTQSVEKCCDTTNSKERWLWAGNVITSSVSPLSSLETTSLTIIDFLDYSQHGICRAVPTSRPYARSHQDPSGQDQSSERSSRRLC